MTKAWIGSGTDIVQMLERCREIELQCSELYQCLAESFHDDAAVSSLFLKTAREEDNHANQFVLAVKMSRLGAIDTVAIDPERATEILKKIGSFLLSVRERKPPLADALRSVITLEEKMEIYHLDAVATFTNVSHRQLFEACMKADQEHVEALRALYRQRFGTS
jgi:rubrerythrin